jgi:hypothetical protein
MTLTESKHVAQLIIFSITQSCVLMAIKTILTSYFVRPGSSVGIATRYGLGGPGIESRWGRDIPHLYVPALWPTLPPV